MAVLSHRSAEPARAPEAAFVLATADLLDEGIPFADLSVEAIARKAGRSRSTFYVHFQDKRELLLYATQEIAERLYAAATGWPSEPAGARSVRSALGSFLSVYRQHRGLLGAVVEASGYDECIREHWRELMGRFVAATERRLADGPLTEGGPSAAATRAKAFALVWMTERACHQQLTGAGVEHDDVLVDALADIWERSANSARGAPRGAFAPPRVESDGRGSDRDERAEELDASARSRAAAARRARRRPRTAPSTPLRTPAR